MSNRQPYASLRRKAAPAVPCGAFVLSGETLVLQLRWPSGGFVWNYPLAVHTTRDGATRHIPIIDVTRVVQLTLWTLTFLAGALALTAHRRKGESHERKQ